MVRTFTGAVLLFALPATAAPVRPPPGISAACKTRFERARNELVDRGFAPTADKDTRRWLAVQTAPDTVQMRLEMRTSADGPATFYLLEVRRPRRVGVEAVRWRAWRGRYCCDDHAAPEDHLHEQRWTRALPPLIATVSVVEFEEALHAPAAVHWREMFTDVARKAADDCLATAATPVGSRPVPRPR
ncbi:MAG TPA: hypothetical protein VLT58_07790 [Polyangia bacterium]|nr:hypothetical protein [Polyangia bacterium]